MNHEHEEAQRKANLEALRERRDGLQNVILDLSEKIRRVLQHDIKRFLERETRARWIQHTEFATSMSNVTLGKLKTDLKDLAQELKPIIQNALEQDALWIPNALPETPTPKSLEGNEALFTTLQTIACKLSALLTEYAFPKDTERGEDDPPYDLVYNTPAYFVDGLYCPGLIETYWTSVGQLLQVQAELDSLTHEHTQKQLELRWASF